MSIINRVAWATERAINAASTAGQRIARAGRPASIQLRQMESWSFGSTWGAAEIGDALESHERGDFSDSARLARAMGRDDRISACRNTRIRALTGRGGANFNLNASEEGDQRRAGTVRDTVEKHFFKVAKEETLSRIQGDVIDLGPSISRIHWYQDRGVGQWLPRLEPWSMEWVRRDEQKDCYVAQTADHGEVEVRGGTGEWLVVEPSGARGWEAGAVRALAMPYFFRGNSWKDWARYCEKHGVPILAIEEPSAQTDVAGKATKDRFYAALRKLGREGVLRLPRTGDGKKGYGASILEPKSLSWPSFEAFLTRLDVCIAIYLLGQNLSTEVSSGSFAAAIAQNRVRLDYLAADAEVLSSCLREQVWMPWGRFNFDWWDDALAPWPTWTTSVPEDLKTKADTLKALSDSLAGFKSAGMPVNIRAIGEQYGIPLLSLKDAETEAAAAAAEAAARKAAEEAARKAAEIPKSDPPTGDSGSAGSSSVAAAIATRALSTAQTAIALSQEAEAHSVHLSRDVENVRRDGLISRDVADAAKAKAEAVERLTAAALAEMNTEHEALRADTDARLSSTENRVTEIGSAQAQADGRLDAMFNAQNTFATVNSKVEQLGATVAGLSEAVEALSADKPEAPKKDAEDD